MNVVVTPTAEHLDIDARRLLQHPQNDTRVFPDDEVYVQIDGIESRDRVVLVHAGQPHPNRGLAYLYGILDLLRENDCPITVLFTYVPYCRQDAAFYDGTLVYARSLLRLVTTHYGVDRVYAVDPHFEHRDWVRELPLERVAAFPLIQDRVKMDEYVVVGPDLGATKRFDVAGFEKVREGAADVDLEGELDVSGRDVLVLDDIVATGGTMKGAYERLKEQGADTVQAAAVHGVLDDGIQRVQETYDAFYLTNTIDTDAANVRIEPLLQEVIS